MSNVLYITAHPLEIHQSYSLTVGKAFIDTYKEYNPNDQVVHLDLYKADIPYLDADVFHGWEKLQNGDSFDLLTPSERSKVGRLAELGGQFLLADKYVFVTPMWNFSFPAIMKTYLDAVAVSGKTFKYSKKGSKGLLKGKKAIHIQARGDIYSEGQEAQWEMGNRQLETIMKFCGVKSFEGIILEGHMKFPEKAEQIKEKAIADAIEAAKNF
ncbi:FMN-dependent NADH-azoreductase [Neobacillus terrae]|uniref:FMN-dependent NADH-azoreductase n=1 Tax=Neobacillus terrae TaxID=3034837 RepID=UPI00140DCDCA|nr:FMN-dependent NADH-azoreductase [Neobacillus terrae]NHM32495.1 FMN-dependent NADH-azoreductase [Neobacillus terrae]